MAESSERHSRPTRPRTSRRRATTPRPATRASVSPRRRSLARSP